MDASIMGWGMHLNDHTAQGSGPNRIHTLEQPPQTVGASLGLQKVPVPHPCPAHSDNVGKHDHSLLHKQKSEVSGPLGGSSQTLEPVYLSSNYHSVVHFPEVINTLADHLSRHLHKDHNLVVQNVFRQ